MSTLYSQATLEQNDYVKRLGIVWFLFFTLLGGPIAYQTFDPVQQVREADCTCKLICACHQAVRLCSACIPGAASSQSAL